MANKEKQFSLIELLDNTSAGERNISLRMDIIGIFVEICLSKKLFKHNIDLKPFIDQIFLNFVDKELPEYLYKSRTQLVARTIRIIFVMENNSLKEFYNRLTKYKYNSLEKLPSNEDDKHDNDDFLDYWSDVINNIKL